MRGRRRNAVARNLDEAAALVDEGIGRLEAQDLPAAERAFRRALLSAPERPEAHLNLGATLERTGAVREAEACYRRALDLGGGLRAHLNLGALLVDQKRFLEARRVYDAAMDLFPASAALWSNLGVLLTCQKEEETAERCCRRAMELDPECARARFNLSYLLLRQGRLEEGWQALEARAWNLDLLARIPAPRWRGEALAGRSLLIGCEGGHGDMIQFGRYASLLKARGAARIGMVCHPPLKRLFASLPGVDVVVALGETVPGEWDFWTLPQSLPLHCGTRLDTIPAPIPYLRASPEEGPRWRARLPSRGIRVGLAWRGNPRFENDADRSLPGLGLLAPWAVVEGLSFVSLQREPPGGEAERLPQGLELFDPSPWIEDFSDTAALISELDLVISVDTAAAHLAGALGRPCWLLLPHHKTDWRWFKDREDSPWYPGSMRLFRQRDGEDWGPAIQAVAAALRALVQPRGGSGPPGPPGLER
jgi:Tfp pilus assembly protein PilF